jgi:hypothetical protein
VLGTCWGRVGDVDVGPDVNVNYNVDVIGWGFEG